MGSLGRSRGMFITPFFEALLALMPCRTRGSTISERGGLRDIRSKFRGGVPHPLGGYTPSHCSKRGRGWGISAPPRQARNAFFYCLQSPAESPASLPVHHAHWKLYPPIRPSQSKISP